MFMTPRAMLPLSRALEEENGCCTLHVSRLAILGEMLDRATEFASAAIGIEPTLVGGALAGQVAVLATMEAGGILKGMF